MTIQVTKADCERAREIIAALAQFADKSEALLEHMVFAVAQGIAEG